MHIDSQDTEYDLDENTDLYGLGTRLSRGPYSQLVQAFGSSHHPTAFVDQDGPLFSKEILDKKFVEDCELFL